MAEAAFALALRHCADEAQRDTLMSVIASQGFAELTPSEQLALLDSLASHGPLLAALARDPAFHLEDVDFRVASPQATLLRAVLQADPTKGPELVWDAVRSELARTDPWFLEAPRA